MSGSKFSISNSIRKAYGFVSRERSYFLKISLLPMGITLITQLLLNFAVGDDATTFQAIVIGLPANALLGWFMFLEARLLLLGERHDVLPDDKDYMANRWRCMQASILVWLVFNMGWAAAIEWAVQAVSATNPNMVASTLALLLVGLSFWGVRFGVAHIVAAVGYPIKRYIYQVDGIGISLRLLALGLMTGLPLLAIFVLVAKILVPEMDAEHAPDPAATIALTVISVPISVFMTAVLTAAACYALQEVLGNSSSGEKTA